jgi:hypothetical protein
MRIVHFISSAQNDYFRHFIACQKTVTDKILYYSRESIEVLSIFLPYTSNIYSSSLITNNVHFFCNVLLQLFSMNFFNVSFVYEIALLSCHRSQHRYFYILFYG